MPATFPFIMTAGPGDIRAAHALLPDCDDPDAIKSLADYMAALERALRARAADLSERQRRWRQIQAAGRFMGDAGDLVLVMIRDGYTEREAVDTCARRTGLSPATVAANMREARKRAREFRDRRIVRLAAAGWMNGEIAAATGLHESTVGRIIRERLTGAPPRGAAGAGPRSVEGAATDPFAATEPVAGARGPGARLPHGK